jgi:uncharacterized protein
MLGWFRALMPKEERFFDLFTRHAQITLAGAQALRALLKGDDDVLRCCREITRLENEADGAPRCGPTNFFWTPARRIWIDKGAINTGA